MIERVIAAGGSLTDEGRLRFPTALVQKTIDQAQRGFTPCGQSPAHDLQIDGSRAYLSTGVAVCGSEYIMELMSNTTSQGGFAPSVSHKGTFNGSPLVAAA